MISIGLTDLKNNLFAVFKGAERIIRIDSIPRDHRAARVGCRIVYEKLAVRGILRVKCEAEKAFLVPRIVHTIANVEENRGVTDSRPLLENADDTGLLEHEEPIASIVRRLKVDRPVKRQVLESDVQADGPVSQLLLHRRLSAGRRDEQDERQGKD
jgi:hypothetical protein